MKGASSGTAPSPPLRFAPLVRPWPDPLRPHCGERRIGASPLRLLRPSLGVPRQTDHRNDPDQDDDEGGERAVLESGPRGMALDEGRERFHVQRAQKQGRGKFLQAIDEDEERRARQRRPQQRQLHAGDEFPRRRAQGAGRILEAAGDAVEARRQGAGRRSAGSGSCRRSTIAAAEPTSDEAETSPPSARQTVLKRLSMRPGASRPRASTVPGNRIAERRRSSAVRVRRFREPRGRHDDEAERRAASVAAAAS